jgi:hypothetical protein
VRALVDDNEFFRAGDVGAVHAVPTWYGAMGLLVKFDCDPPRHGDGLWMVAESDLERETP